MKSKFRVLGGVRSQGSNLKALTESHHQERSLRPVSLRPVSGLWLCVLGRRGGRKGERVSASIASPCVRSKRPRVYRHQAHIFHTCGLGAGTHGDVLNVHTEAFFNVHTVFFFFHVFSPCRNTNTHSPNTHHDHNDTHHTTQHGDRNRERQRKRDKTRQEKRRRDKTSKD